MCASTDKPPAAAPTCSLNQHLLILLQHKPMTVVCQTSNLMARVPGLLLILLPYPCIPSNMASTQQVPAQSSTRHYYTRRYHDDPEFRAQEKARTAEKVRANYAHYQQLWREAYLRRKARNKQGCVHPIQNIPYPKMCDSIAHGAANSNSHG